MTDQIHINFGIARYDRVGMVSLFQVFGRPVYRRVGEHFRFF